MSLPTSEQGRIEYAKRIHTRARSKTELRQLARNVLTAFEHDGLEIVRVDPDERTITIRVPARGEVRSKTVT